MAFAQNVCGQSLWGQQLIKGFHSVLISGSNPGHLDYSALWHFAKQVLRGLSPVCILTSSLCSFEYLSLADCLSELPISCCWIEVPGICSPLVTALSEPAGFESCEDICCPASCSTMSTITLALLRHVFHGPHLCDTSMSTF